MIYEAECKKCDEIFNPDSEEDLEHIAREDGTPCGGTGVMLGTWGGPVQ
jgi:hypothetical protein